MFDARILNKYTGQIRRNWNEYGLNVVLSVSRDRNVRVLRDIGGRPTRSIRDAYNSHSPLVRQYTHRDRVSAVGINSWGEIVGSVYDSGVILDHEWKIAKLGNIDLNYGGLRHDSIYHC